MAIVEGMAGLRNFPIQKTSLMALFYLSGAVIYVIRVPEKFCPGIFDIWVSHIRADLIDEPRASSQKPKA
jgi:predicted membrane channel-forming protein YqfA (hemolysin III family)